MCVRGRTQTFLTLNITVFKMGKFNLDITRFLGTFHYFHLRFRFAADEIRKKKSSSTRFHLFFTFLRQVKIIEPLGEPIALSGRKFPLFIRLNDFDLLPSFLPFFLSSASFLPLGRLLYFLFASFRSPHLYTSFTLLSLCVFPEMKQQLRNCT